METTWEGDPIKIRCQECGKFLSPFAADVMNTFTPDAVGTVESLIWYHVSCYTPPKEIL
jgi:uncharacterized OB-fold protein